ncbi:putative 4-hydroxy-3-methylbut-2-enyl diphosphate reductase [Helianthus annuus]|uniref:4-hydroxy-3-methylbut-2-enyl diphosphate reductase n=1 Tax=Helianthus annuus TaxID=4232 RepID=A0A251TTS0_HELAN|nr:putative 4-hydroxy-3-methylbut-2-enyl diphosphate reductase [Helianthus annuus]KAJ0525259.1 putative 4-hydroxy-3-methylbut-2-enyl diphosphate reductase [Helianthus annuus]KAJ0533314.1 putative 4-hydroxy-3-methylbut-2-enyl diphosphate reductase [Helianthus annuus]KAJ0541632.1 putative 4-hydroxy-3-methylbut-2-enyl diphosphate reductase [Helianthus annuus]KAJ0706707.1 putative 4-hydroxy-3-methylbut-2-enyl diphosphate reductase [Helianthus annuus]
MASLQLTPLPTRSSSGCRSPLSVRCSSGGGSSSSPSVSIPSDFDGKVFRHNLTRSDNYNRKGFGHKKETLQLMTQEYASTAYFFPLPNP